MRMEIPLFPLGTTLFPQGLLPLKIFEVRYLDMVKRCYKEREVFGVVTLLDGQEVRRPQEDVVFADYGTLAKIIQFDAPNPSLWMILCEGQQRFQILNKRCEKNGLWMAEIELLVDDDPVAIPDELLECSRLLESVLKRISDPNSATPALVVYPWRLEECGWVANRWCEFLPMSGEQKQHLLALDNPRLRLDLVRDVLEDLGAIGSSSKEGGIQ